MLLIFQILFFGFFLTAEWSVYRRMREGRLRRSDGLFWAIFWLFALFVVLYPNVTSIWAGYLGIGRGADMIVYVALSMVFFLLFRQGIAIESLRRSLTKKVRDEAFGRGKIERLKD